MKSLLFTLTLLLFCLISNAQDGLGEFKISKTKVDFVISKYPEFVEVTDSTDYPLARKFHCEKYKMLNIEVSDIEVFFYNDILISFRCNRDPLIEIYLASKYGRPKINQKNHVINVDQFTSYDEETNTYTWDNEKGSISAISTYTRQFNQYFKVMTNSYFYIYLKGSEKITNYKWM